MPQPLIVKRGMPLLFWTIAPAQQQTAAPLPLVRVVAPEQESEHVPRSFVLRAPIVRRPIPRPIIGQSATAIEEVPQSIVLRAPITVRITSFAYPRVFVVNQEAAAENGMSAISFVRPFSGPTSTGTPERWFAAQIRGQNFQAKSPRDTFAAQQRGQTFISEVVR